MNKRLGVGAAFYVPGKPTPQGSHRAFVRGKRANIVESNKVLNWRATVALHAASQGQYALAKGTAGHLTAVFAFERPPSHYLKSGHLSAAGRRALQHARKPDLDKLVRAVGDALTGVLYQDDSQIVSLTARKIWHTSRSGLYVALHSIWHAPVSVTELLAHFQIDMEESDKCRLI